ncbi:hypothetical protein AQUCO_01100328v1 [Aquilegia coerulea]|uniref:Uncharacterized protein n=1 Tax=Aquilegia coerulea TaxID=218851 RepID=A0A2G5E6N8_AQUCA|nr:hypothetical protein AQUCO_01100328v1 [Aquilegia coerulea]PIA51421.1 hypothetical protein AQUCO_01100328v1 [Aquilegia coerulea]
MCSTGSSSTLVFEDWLQKWPRSGLNSLGTIIWPLDLCCHLDFMGRKKPSHIQNAMPCLVKLKVTLCYMHLRSICIFYSIFQQFGLEIVSMSLCGFGLLCFLSY